MHADEELDLSVYSSEAVEIEMDGRTYRGIRFVIGTDELRQAVHFGDLREIDPKPHSPRDADTMQSMARVILRELVEQWKAQEARRPAKVQPASNARRRAERA